MTSPHDLATAATEPAVHDVGTWPSTRRLRAALRANTVFSVLCGVAMVAGGWSAAAPWGLGPAALLPALGLVVALFGVLVARLAVAPALPLRRWATVVVAADLGWVLGSIALLLLVDVALPGAVAVAAVAAAVAALAGWQLAGVATVRGDDPLADVEIIETASRVNAAPEQVWPLLIDHDLYGRLAPSLSMVEVISEPDRPLRRRCTDTRGRGWEESCTLWDEGRRFAVEVDTTDYPYPLSMMRGLWQVDPHPTGSTVIMRFAYQANPTVIGGLFAVAFRPLFPPVLARIVRGWRARLPQ